MSDFYCIRCKVTLKRDHAGRPSRIRNYQSPMFDKERRDEREAARDELQRMVKGEGHRLGEMWGLRLCRVKIPEPT